MKKKVIVLGGGLVGKVMALDLATDYEVTVADRDETVLNDLAQRGIQARSLDFSDRSAMAAMVAPFDLVVGAVPGFLGYQMVQTVIEAGKNLVDISFFPEDPFALDPLAREKGVTVVTDCGVAPGMSNIVLGYHNEQMKVQSFECLVGGLPVAREWPFEYKAVFSPIDVIEEYIRPARYVQNGAVVVRETLSDAELINLQGVGTLESWNSDGLRSLIKTMPHIPNMIEKTLRYPGTIEYLRVLRHAGFFNYEPVMVNGQPIRPVDVTARLLFPTWKLKPGEEEFTVMRITVAGIENGKETRHVYNLLDRTDKSTGTLSMARTTGYTCTAAAHLVLDGKFTRKGICPPEYLGASAGALSFVDQYLRARGVVYHHDISHV